MASMGRTMSVAAAVAAVGALAVGCTITFGNHSNAPKVSKEELQNEISQRLAHAGQTAQSVTCPNDLVGEVGQSTRCDVAMGVTGSFQPIVTVTSLEGKKVNYDIAPAVSQSQLEVSVAHLIAKTKAPPDSVSCQSGLDGKVGAVAYCDATEHDVTTRRVVTVVDLTGLQMKYILLPVLPKSVVESSLVFQMSQSGQQPDAVACVGDLQGKVGNTVECTTEAAGQSKTYVVTVTAVNGDSISYKYAEKR